MRKHTNHAAFLYSMHAKFDVFLVIKEHTSQNIDRFLGLLMYIDDTFLSKLLSAIPWQCSRTKLSPSRDHSSRMWRDLPVLHIES